jgi:hypothetical protein
VVVPIPASLELAPFFLSFLLLNQLSPLPPFFAHSLWCPP